MILFFLLNLIFVNVLSAHPYEITLLDIDKNSSVLYNPALIQNENGLTFYGSCFKTFKWYSQEDTYIKMRNIGFSFQEKSLIPWLFFSVNWNHFQWGYEKEMVTGFKEKDLVLLHQSFYLNKISFGLNEKIYSFNMSKNNTEFSKANGFGVDIGIKYKLLKYIYFLLGINDIGYTKIEDENLFFYVQPKYITGISFFWNYFSFYNIFHTNLEKFQSYHDINIHIFSFLILNTGFYSFDFFTEKTLTFNMGLGLQISQFCFNYNFNYFKYPENQNSQIVNRFLIKINFQND